MLRPPSRSHTMSCPLLLQRPRGLRDDDDDGGGARLGLSTVLPCVWEAADESGLGLVSQNRS